MRSALRKCMEIIKEEGVGALARRVRENTNASYRSWIRANEPTSRELARQCRAALPQTPLISFLCPTYNTKRRHLRALVRSCLYQTRANWELCIADGGSGRRCVARLRRLARANPHIRLVELEQNRGIGGNTRAAAEIARGDFFAFIDHDDTLSPFAVYELTAAIEENPDADFFYSDEDKLSLFGRRDPRFKPAWSPDTLKSYNYVTHLMMLSRTLYLQCGGVREGYDGSQDHDLALRAGECAQKVVHIPKILYHWRAHRGSVAGGGEKPYAFEAGRKAVESALRRESDFAPAAAEYGLFPSSYRARYPVRGNPLVSIVVPNRNHAALLRRCVKTVEETAYNRIEWVIVENGSTDSETFWLYEKLARRDNVRIVPMNRPFNYSAANNLGARQAQGDLLLFLNNDIAAAEDNWMEAMMEHALRPDVGAVGAKLFFGDGRIQHAGVVVGLGGWADHVCAGMRNRPSGYANHLVNVVRDVSAVTGACLMTERRKFVDAGGFDEDFILCGSDVELCLRYLGRGYVNIYTPFARLLHLESATRQGMDIPARDYEKSLAAYRPFLLKGDPYYSISFDYTQKRPALACKPAPPAALNPLLRCELEKS